MILFSLLSIYLVVSELVSTTMTLGFVPLTPFNAAWSIAAAALNPPPNPDPIGPPAVIPPNWPPAMCEKPALEENGGRPPKPEMAGFVGGGGVAQGKPAAAAGFGAGSLTGAAGLQGKYLRSGTGPEIFDMEIPSGRVSLSKST